MRVVILAAGQSKRFRDAGYITPKPFLRVKWRGSPMIMLDHVLHTLPLNLTGYASDCSITVGIPSDPVLLSYTDTQYADNEIKFVQIENSKGPADTALKIVEHLPPKSTLFLDVDVLNTSNDLELLMGMRCSGVLVSVSHNPAFSYVDRLGEFNIICEEERISDMAVQGAYYVYEHNMNEFIYAAKEVIDSVEEPYISHVFNECKFSKLSTFTTYNPIHWGTPQDLELSGARIISEKGG
jgi:dTDP-glucose pyrophosphorylase